MLGLASKQSTVTHPKPVFLFTVVTSGGGCGGGGGVGGEGDDGPLRGVVLEAALLLLSCPAAEVPRSSHQLVVQRTHQRKLFLPTQTLVILLSTANFYIFKTLLHLEIIGLYGPDHDPAQLLLPGEVCFEPDAALIVVADPLVLVEHVGRGVTLLPH